MHDKILNHVSIDRFTGGAIDGALFSEKATYGKDTEFTTEILLHEKAVKRLIEKENSDFTLSFAKISSWKGENPKWIA